MRCAVRDIHSALIPPLNILDIKFLLLIVIFEGVVQLSPFALFVLCVGMCYLTCTVRCYLLVRYLTCSLTCEFVNAAGL